MKFLGEFLRANAITQSELADGIGMTEAHVSKIVLGKGHASQQTIDAVLAFLCSHLGRAVTYEELAGSPEECA